MGRARRAHGSRPPRPYGGGGLAAARRARRWPAYGAARPRPGWPAAIVGQPFERRPRRRRPCTAPGRGDADRAGRARRLLGGRAWASTRPADRRRRSSPAALAAVGGRPVRLTNVAVIGAQSGDLDGQVASALAEVPRARRRRDHGRRQRRDPPDRPVGRRAPPGPGGARLREAGAEVVVGTCPDLGTIEPVAQPLRLLARRWSRDLAAAQTVAVVEAGGRTVSLGDLLGPGVRGAPARDVQRRPVPPLGRRLRPGGRGAAAQRLRRARPVADGEAERAPDCRRGEGVGPGRRRRRRGRARPRHRGQRHRRSAASRAARAAAGPCCCAGRASRSPTAASWPASPTAVPARASDRAGAGPAAPAGARQRRPRARAGDEPTPPIPAHRSSIDRGQRDRALAEPLIPEEEPHARSRHRLDRPHARSAAPSRARSRTSAPTTWPPRSSRPRWPRCPALDPALSRRPATSAAPSRAASTGSNMARVVAVLAGLDHLPGATVNRFCSSSACRPPGWPSTRSRPARATSSSRPASSASPATSGFAGAGGCNGRLAEPACSPRPRPAARRTPRPRTRPGHDPREDGLLPDVYIAMGQTAENVAGLRGVTRARQDEWGVASQNRAEKAIADGFFAREITPVTTPDGTVVSTDDGPRAGRHPGGRVRRCSRCSAPTARSPPATAARSTTAPPRSW